MARVELMPGIKSISGTIGNLTFRTRGGKTFVYSKLDPELPRRATRAQRELWLRRMVLDRCVRLIQSDYEDMYEAIRQRPLIRQRLVTLYAKYRVETSARTKLQKQIMQEYGQRYGRDGGVKRP